MRARLLSCTAALIALSLMPLHAATRPPKKAATGKSEKIRFAKLLDDFWQDNLKRNPEFASTLGDRRYNDQMSDFSQKAIDEGLSVSKEFLKRAAAIDGRKLGEQDRITRDLLIEQLRQNLDEAPYRLWEMQVNQISGLHIDLPQLVGVLPFESVKDYDDYVARLKQFPRVFDENIEQLRRGIADGLMPPKYLLEKVVTQTRGIAGQKVEESPFAGPLAQMPSTFSESEKSRIRESVLGAIRGSVLPSYVSFANFLEKEYVPKGRSEAGIWSLPHGNKIYQLAIQRFTTTSMTADQVHALGLSEVKRIEAEELKLARELGFSDLKSLRAEAESNPALRAGSREALLQQYRDYIDSMRPLLPKLFGRLPKAAVDVLPVEAFREAQATGASYVPGSPDGTRPGHIMVNASFYDKPGVGNEATAYHEGVPGHHMQLAIAQEIPNLPPYRQQAFFGAYIEGWALYAEQLAKEAGMYKNRYSDFGRLQSEMFRAVRLVVDSGMHAKHWTREQALDYMRDHVGAAEDGAIEIDRYIVWPGQALSYKIGQLKFLELRQKAKKELGAEFDLRSFHDELLNGGALPLDLLERRINAWIERNKKS